LDLDSIWIISFQGAELIFTSILFYYQIKSHKRDFDKKLFPLLMILLEIIGGLNLGWVVFYFVIYLETSTSLYCFVITDPFLLISRFMIFLFARYFVEHYVSLMYEDQQEYQSVSNFLN